MCCLPLQAGRDGGNASIARGAPLRRFLLYRKAHSLTLYRFRAQREQLMTFTPESGLDCFIRAIFARQWQRGPHGSYRLLTIFGGIKDFQPIDFQLIFGINDF